MFYKLIDQIFQLQYYKKMLNWTMYLKPCCLTFHTVKSTLKNSSLYLLCLEQLISNNLNKYI